LSALDFLKGLDRNMIAAITSACAHIAISRRDDLRRLQITLAE
jgi:hypothetical protein